MKKTMGLLLLILAVLPICAGAQIGEGAPRRVLLPCGVRLILKPEPASELVAISICIRMEPDHSPQEAATGELVARGLFGSSQNRSRAAIRASLAQVGGSLAVLRTPDHVSINCIALPEQSNEAAYLLCEMLKNADFTPEVLADAGKKVASERAAQDSSGFLNEVQSLRLTLQGAPELDESQYRRVTPSQAAAYFRARYVPERTAVSVVGRFEARAMQTAFDNDLFDFDRHEPRPLRDESLFAHATQSPTLTVKKQGKSGVALVATPVPSVSSPDYPAFLVMNSLLGGGHASRLFRRIRDSKGIGYYVGALYLPDQSDLMISYLQWAAQPVNVASNNEPLDGPKAVRLLTDQLDGLLSDPPTLEETERAKSVAIGKDALAHERSRDRAALLAWYEAMGAGYTMDSDLPRRIETVTKEDILRISKTYLAPRASAVIVPAP